MTATFSDLELSEGAQAPQSRDRLRPNLRIPMRDGTELIGDLYVPSGAGPWPVIVQRTCYAAAALGPLADCYTAHGYLFLAVDVRGRYRSAGEWNPLTHEKTDGPDVLQWAARLPECDGRVGTRGHSYDGVNQLIAAPHAGDCLKAMVACVAPGDPFDNVPFQGGAYDISDFMWAWFQVGPISQIDPNTPESDQRLIAALAAGPLGELDVRLGLRNPFFREWIKHWRLDKYWQQRSWLPDLPQAKVPTLHLSGCWDNNGRGSVRAFSALGGASGGQRLVIGPWEHLFGAPCLDDLPEYEQALVNRAALRDAFTDELAWFEQHLKAQPPRLPAVEVFITGAWRWIEAADWPLPQVAETAWYLAADGGISTAPARRGQRQYEFNPAVPNEVENGDLPVAPAPYDTTPDVRDDVLVYRSEPLVAQVLALGDVRMAIEATTTAADIDWVVRLVDEYPDGRAICIRDGILRARFRHGFDRPRPVKPGKRESYSVDLWHVGHLFRAGHRIRVEICSSQLGRWDVNPGDGGDLATSTAKVVSTQTVLHGGPRGSQLRLPLCPPELAAELLWEG